MANLHLGCGTRRLAGWVNADADPAVNPDLVLPAWGALAGDAYDWIYASHVVEHVPPDLLPAGLAHLHRALRPGGILTLATIDLDGIYRNAYQRGYAPEAWNSYLYGDARSTASPLMAHRQCFTAPYLTALLAAAGFVTVRPWALGQYPAIAALGDCAATSHHVTLYLEGVK